jgi:hypothetical protein
MPPVLGWAAMRGDVGAEALAPVPDHLPVDAAALLGAGAVPRRGLPPSRACRCCRSRTATSSRGCRCCCTRWCCSRPRCCPSSSCMSGWIYLVAAVVLGAMFIAYAWRLWRDYSDGLARKTFRFSIWHLSLLFAALLVDHYLSSMAAPLVAILAAGRCSCWPAATGWRRRRSKPAFKGIDITGAEYARTTEPARCRRQAAHAGRLQGQGDGGVLRLHQCPDVCPTTLAELAAASSKRWAPTARACRACSSRSTPSATRPRC